MVRNFFKQRLKRKSGACWGLFPRVLPLNTLQWWFEMLMLMLTLCFLQHVHQVTLRRGQDLVGVTHVRPTATRRYQAPPTARVTLVTIVLTLTRRTLPAPVRLTSFHLPFLLYKTWNFYSAFPTTHRDSFFDSNYISKTFVIWNMTFDITVTSFRLVTPLGAI